MISNLTRKTILAKEHTICNTLHSKAKGLMFSPKPRALIMLFRPAQPVSLHMWFVFFPIDVLFLDSHQKVICMKQSFMPFSFFKCKEKAMYVIELKKGSIAKSRTRIGDKLYFNLA
ncbi:MAG: DUF192 domain-containing protein [Candidatus Woesearchaeota archaeon]